jgi:hypothetical protein
LPQHPPADEVVISMRPVSVFANGPEGEIGQLNVFEMTWDNDGRATFSYGAGRVPGQPHVIWRRIGTHDIPHPATGPITRERCH